MAPKKNQFVEHVVEIMRGFGSVESKAMFGGYGLYHEGVFFALVAEDTLYLKSDAENAAEFDAGQLPPFVYESKVGERIVMSYRQAPAEALDSPAVMETWARLGYGAALRAVRAKVPGKPRRKSEAPS
ncbi:MAG TPA: TfoX/Sxy family protein [Usitatibacter sp.]|nr:TfoX/Sxy family protein [Usitatibacter sp.]